MPKTTVATIKDWNKPPKYSAIRIVKADTGMVKIVNAITVLKTLLNIVFDLYLVKQNTLWILIINTSLLYNKMSKMWTRSHYPICQIRKQRKH